MAAAYPVRALALYQLARTAGAPTAYEVAAHALAAALEAALTVRRMDRPADHREAAHMVANSGYTPEAAAYELTTRRASPPCRPRAKSALAGDDLTAPTSLLPRKHQAVNAYTVRWADGAETFVSSVVSDARKPASRGATAFRAADRLRRRRSRAEYLASLESGADGVECYDVDSSGLRRDAPAFLELLKCRPLPPLAGIRDETTGETFEAPDGSVHGAGDAARALELEAAICRPRMAARYALPPFEGAIPLARSDFYFLPIPDGFEDDGRPGPRQHCATGWPEAWRKAMRADALAAFAPEPAAIRTAAVGESLAMVDPRDIERADAVIDLEAARARAALPFPEAEPKSGKANSYSASVAWESRRNAWQAGARAAVAMAERDPGRVYTLRAGPLGRSFSLEASPSVGRTFDRAALAFIARAA